MLDIYFLFFIRIIKYKIDFFSYFTYDSERYIMSTTQQNFTIMQGNSLQTIHEAVYASLDTYGSKTRFANYRRSNFYLLDVERHPESYCIKVAGSTRNIYDVKINETDKTIKCNCPDGAGYCRGNNTICKHSYFVLLKMLRMRIGCTAFNFSHKST